MGNNQNSSLLCAVIHDPESGKMCGTEGDASVMFYSRLPDGMVIVACPTCNTQLDTGFKAALKPYRYANVASVRALADFKIELVDGLRVNKGHCSFHACGCQLDGEMVVRNGEEYRRVCNNDASALNIVATRAKEQLALHASGKRKLSKRDLAEVEAQTKLMPESVQSALEAIRKLQEQAHARIKAATNLALAQLKTAPTAPKPEVKSQSKPEAKATALVAEKTDGRKRLPKNFGSRFRVMVANENMKREDGKSDRKLGLISFLKACHRANEGKTVLPEEIAQTARGRFELARSDQGLAVLVRLGKRQAPAASALAPEAPVPVAPSAPAASAEAQA